MGRSSETLAWVAVTVCVALLLFAWFNGMFPQDWYPEGGEITFNTWTLQVSSEPFGGGYTSISGNNSIGQFESITVYATAKSGYAFSHWIFDSQQYPTNPQITIPSQNVNSTHTLKAVFIPKIATFEASPSITVVRGADVWFFLKLKNNADANLTAVKLKLNDHYGMFTKFEADVHVFSGNYPHPLLNRFDDIIGVGCKNVYWTPKSTVQIHIHYVVNSTIASGTYHLSFETIFTVVSGEFETPPELTFPWDVTILG